MAKLSLLLATLIVSFCESRAFPNIVSITEVVSYAKNFVDIISDLDSPIVKLQNGSDDQLAQRINATRNSIMRMIRSKIRNNRTETNIIGIKHILERDNFTVFVLNEAILNSLLPRQKLQININKILIKAKTLIDDLPQFESGAYSALHGMLYDLKSKLHLESNSYNRAMSKMFLATTQSEWKFKKFKVFTRLSSTLSVLPEMFQRLSSGILDVRSDNLMDKIYPMFVAQTAFRVPGFYKALYNYLSHHKNRLKFENACDVDVPYPNQIKQIYEMVLLIDYRIFIMTIAVRKYQEILQEGYYDGGLSIETQYIKGRIEHYLEAMKTLMYQVPKGRKRCDLKEHMIDDNSFRLSNLSAPLNETTVLSLVPQVADLGNNMVVTNMRLQKKDNIVYVQIQQGRLLPNGAIDQSTLKWLPFDKIVRTGNPTSPFELLEADRRVPLVLDKHFTYLQLGDAKLNIDDIILPPEYAITGVTFEKFQAIDYDQWSSDAIGFRVFATPFNYRKGILSPSNTKPSEWVSINDYVGIDDDGVYRKFEIERENHFLDFHMSKLSNNSEEVTLPFLDSRPVGVTSPTSLGGIGVVERKAANNGTLLVPKLISLDHSAFVNDRLPPDETRSYERQLIYFDPNEETDYYEDEDNLIDEDE